ncbi:MAG: hypothetical protein JWR52_1050 [Marmoricola sp.]|nr:hypothetical protein [Marmoricola sp.]
MSLFTRRLGALVATSALAVSGLGLLASPAGAVPPPNPAMTAGADWLAGQLSSGLMHNPNFGGFDDYGLTIDTAFALSAVPGHTSDVSDIATALAPNIAGTAGYTEADEFSYPANLFVQHGFYAGPTAKALVFAQLAGQDPTTYGGVNLVQNLENRVLVTGRIADDSSYGDFANTIGQAYAAEGLAAAGSTKAADALTFLLEQQCAAGYFRLNFAAADATDQTCDATGGPADPDVTSTAILALHAQIDTNAKVARAIGKAEAWLLAQQHADGSFSGGTSTNSPNANSTGLAGWALGELGDATAAQHAAVWVRQHQADELAGCPTQLTSQTGAVAYDGTALANGRAVGITTSTQDQWRRATSQALAVLQWAPTATPALALSGPTGYVEAGKTASYRVSGAVPGETVCVSGIAISVPGAAGIGGTAAIRVAIPPGTATRTISVTDGVSTTSVLTKSLGAAILHVTPARYRVTHGKLVKVTVSGLAAGEKVTLRFRGRVVATGTATSTGRFVRFVRVGRILGRATLSATGQFADLRRGHTLIRVIA